MNAIESCCSKKDVSGKKYVPPVLGNGDLSIQIDFEGVQAQNEYCGMKPGIYRAGHRYHAPQYPLVNFGHLLHDIGGAGTLLDWEQTLDVTNAIVRTTCKYESGLIVSSEIFCHLGRNVLAIRKRFSGPARLPEYTLNYHLPRNRRIDTIPLSDATLAYDVDGMERYLGKISLRSSSRPICAKSDNNIISISTQGDVTDYFLLFEKADENDGASLDWDSLFESHRKLWAEYWKESYIHIPSEKIMKVYHTAQYHLRISSTEYSIPTGIFPGHWQGRYFAYDEIFAFDALLGGGHLSTARKIIEFRYRTLQKAIRRASKTLDAECKIEAAHFPWETLEDGSEGAPEGYWMDHIFQTANVGIAACWYAQYSADKEFLKEKAYPVIRACAEFFRAGHIYHVANDKTIVGKCSDLERLGAFRENAFVTTCAVISLFRLASKLASAVFPEDANTAEEWKDLKDLAEKLYKSLPCDGVKYIPYPGCTQRSIASYLGIYPYRAIDPSDKMQEAAVADADSHQNEFALQYFAGGTTMSTWYSGIIAAAKAISGSPREALGILEKAAMSTGCFNECFEVFEKGMRPWFSTAEGAFVGAVHLLLLRNSRITPGISDIFENFSFVLQGEGGRKFEAFCKNGVCELKQEDI